MESACSSETSVEFCRTTRRYNPKDSSLHNKRCEKLKTKTSFDLKQILASFISPKCKKKLVI
jgi:hypothetical protein